MLFRRFTALLLVAALLPGVAHRKRVAYVPPARVPPARSTISLFEAPVPRRPTPPPQTNGVIGGLAVQNNNTNVDHFVVRASFVSGAAQTRRYEFGGGGKTIRGSLALDSYGTAQALPYGVVNVGTEERFVQAGDQQDPLAGLIFYPARATGVAYVDLAQGASAFYVQRNYGMHVIGASRAVRNTTFSLVTTASQPLAGVLAEMRFTSQSESGSLTKEVWFGPKGLAAGLLYQTPGRFFLESSNAFATQGLPLAVDDVQRRENAGYRVSPALTLRGGFASAYGAPSSLYFNTTLVTRNGSAIISKAARSTSLGIASHDESGFAEFAYASAPHERDWHFDGAHIMGRGQIDVEGLFMRNGYSDARVDWRSSRSGAAFVAGAEREYQGTLHFTGLLAGVSVPINSYLSAEFELRPSSGRQSMRISFAQRIDVPAVHTVRRTAVTTTAQQPAQLLYFLDDAPLASDVLQGGILIPDGSHTLIVTTRDYQRSSLPLAVRGGMPSVAVQLYPVRSISGRIAVSDPEDFVRPPELDGIEVQLIPGTAATSTDAGGSFHLPPAAVTPGAQLHIVDESLPEGLSAGDAATVKDGTVTVFVHATRRIERLKHRSSLP